MKIYCDLTVGTGGHAEKILEASSPGGKLVGIDRDAQALETVRERLSGFVSERWDLIHTTFSGLKREIMERHIRGFDGILADFGISSFQLDNPDRGFSFASEGPLDMRMDETQALSAFDIVNRSSAFELTRILREYGNERYAPRIASAVVSRARKKKIATTVELADIVRRAVGRSRSGRIDAATRAFQALRIAVNDELGEVTVLMDDMVDLLNPGGVVVCISYHSLEDGIVKRAMAKARKEDSLEILTPKPVGPSREEIMANRRARSARLRAARKRERSGG